jgi:methylamine dehydrogenase accessory protein MauD
VIALYVSTVLLWLAVGVLALLVLALARQVGVLHERVAPLGALMLDQGPKVGERAPIFEVKDLFGRPPALGG